jgi:hypothetical protein
MSKGPLPARQEPPAVPGPIDRASVPSGDGDEAYERLVRAYVGQFRAGKGIPMPILIKGPTGRTRLLDEDARARVEAARRCGLDDVRGYVIDDPGPEALEELRRDLKAARPAIPGDEKDSGAV